VIGDGEAIPDGEVEGLEERDLLAEHGPRYDAYRRSVPMLMPRPRLNRGIAAKTAEDVVR